MDVINGADSTLHGRDDTDCLEVAESLEIVEKR